MVTDAPTEVLGNGTEIVIPSVFVNGWRPFVGWVCGWAFAYHFIVEPSLAFVFATLGYPVVLPEFNLDELTTVLFGLLGLSGLRTYEKVKGVA